MELMSKSISKRINQLSGGRSENPLEPLTPESLRVIVDLAILMREKGAVHIRELVRQASRSSQDRVLAIDVVGALLEGHLVEGGGGMVIANPSNDLGGIFKQLTSQDAAEEYILTFPKNLTLATHDPPKSS